MYDVGAAVRALAKWTLRIAIAAAIIGFILFLQLLDVIF